MGRIITTVMILSWGLWSSSPAWAHFLWIVGGEHTSDKKIHVYFSDEPAADDPALLDRVLSAQAWQGPNWEKITLQKGTESLEGEGKGPVFVLQHDYGVVAKGQSPFLLTYYAKGYAHRGLQHWVVVHDPHVLPLEIVPRIQGERLVLQVLWQGKLLPKAEVVVNGEKLERITGETDERGEFSLDIPWGQKIWMRARYIEEKSGKLGDKEFSSHRIYSTLVLHLPDSHPVSGLPRLEPPVTSFGGAVLGHQVYVYGGHMGEAHHYYREGASARFARLDLDHPQQGWQDLGAVPPRVGTALVAWQQQLIRIGGFLAENSQQEARRLRSLPDVSVYDLQTQSWHDETPLPRGRSSHDATVLGDHVYVVGGWELGSSDEERWHHDMLVADLRQRPLVWESIEVPFRRRALAVAGWQGKLYVLGGMRQQGGPTTEVSIYDPTTRRWMEGPALPGTPMEGFGTSATAYDGQLFATTMSGRLWRFTTDGSGWRAEAQFVHPRFFHRLLPVNDWGLVMVGGAHMATGKISELETWRPAPATSLSAR
ncbi:MAG: hypothetical protein KatS3mg113_0529 [Planctomycetaceae bacterium]|nr:MAG: hypothetical protein KatS3mg113_0529 [Planctomycetaceae bacterium]